ncbi:hypothetical protein AB0M46_43970 [Dactylosporangium sp. NPDC051485]|uniref:hypothetical protein n=1 Tax=Dactylosporangium sp. NPDC051485 TaxID=3154846 RepID=UPI00342BA81A
MGLVYWDPVPEVDAVFPVDGSSIRPFPEAVFQGKWEERNWRNVPGPFYGAMTDTCLMGRKYSTRHFLYSDEDDEDCAEFLYRQPADVAELKVVLLGMQADPWSGWARDGNAHWTHALVREWWRDRGRVLEWISAAQRRWIYFGEEDREAVAGLLDYRAYIQRGLARDLRLYMYFLDHGAGPARLDRLPEL